MTLKLDPVHSSLEIFTFAEGLLARLAHDLRLSSRALEGAAERADDGSIRVTARVRVGSLRVDGVMKGGALDGNTLSLDDKDEILKKTRGDVLGATSDDAALELEGTLRGGTFSGTLRSGSGKAARFSGDARIEATEGGERARGAFEVSVRELCGHDVKGPLGAFKVRDKVRVTFDVVATPAP